MAKNYCDILLGISGWCKPLKYQRFGIDLLILMVNVTIIVLNWDNMKGIKWKNVDLTI